MSKGRETLQEVRTKIQSYCVVRDRCHSEVRSKLLSMHVYGDDLEEILSELIAEGFLDEERFARSYARGQFRTNRWGRNKIIHGLRGRQVTDYCIRKGLEEIDEDVYLATLHELISKHLKDPGSAQARQKTLTYMQQKGYEYALVMERLNALRKQ